MAYKLKVKNGKVKAILRTGKDLVKTEINEEGAKHIISDGKMQESTVDGYPICVNNEWFFEGTEVKTEEKKSDSKVMGKKKK